MSTMIAEDQHEANDQGEVVLGLCDLTLNRDEEVAPHPASKYCKNWRPLSCGARPCGRPHASDLLCVPCARMESRSGLGRAPRRAIAPVIAPVVSEISRRDQTDSVTTATLDRLAALETRVAQLESAVVVEIATTGPYVPSWDGPERLAKRDARWAGFTEEQKAAILKTVANDRKRRGVVAIEMGVPR